MWASVSPLTSPHGVGKVDGSPVTSTSDSGNVAQPSAGANANVPAFAGSTSVSPPPASVASALPAAGSETLKAPVVPSTLQSASALG
jgi:hypothetical protein